MAHVNATRPKGPLLKEVMQVWVKDVKSSNGTFLNGKRLSEENQQSEATELKNDDRLDFGIDINNEDGSGWCSLTVQLVLIGILNADDSSGSQHCTKR